MSEEKKSLIELTTGYLDLLDRAYELEFNGEDVPDELQDSIGEMLTAQADKVDNCASLVSYCKHQQEWLKSEKKRIDIEVKKMTYMQDKIKYLAGHAMDMEGVDKISGNKGHYFSKRKSTSVSIDDLSKLPGDLTQIIVEPIKADILKLLRDGQTIPGASLRTNFSVTVK